MSLLLHIGFISGVLATTTREGRRLETVINRALLNMAAIQFPGKESVVNLVWHCRGYWPQASAAPREPTWLRFQPPGKIQKVLPSGLEAWICNVTYCGVPSSWNRETTARSSVG